MTQATQTFQKTKNRTFRGDLRKIEAIGRSVVRYFGVGASSVPREIASTVTQKGSDAESVSWEEWSARRESWQAPAGWTFCRFSICTEDARVRFVTGWVKGGIGLHVQEMMVGLSETIPPLARSIAILTNLESGNVSGFFDDINQAAEASDIMAALRWDHVPSPGDIFATTFQAWTAWGLTQTSAYHVHIPGGIVPLWHRTFGHAQGKPEKAS